MSPFSLLVALLPLLALAQATPSWEGCLTSGSAPEDSVAISTESASDCASACWDNLETSQYAYWDWQSDEKCLCSSVPPQQKDFTLINDDETFGTCPEGISVYIRVLTPGYLQSNTRKQRLGVMRKVREIVESICPSPLTACAVADSSSYYQCIDTNNAIDSCGGCINGILGSSDTSNSAIDCTTLEGVASKAATCMQGKCRAFRCETGYALGANHTCIAL